MILCLDIDGTICTNTDGEYLNAEPFMDVITQINLLFDAGHRIVFHTARGGTTGIDWYPETVDQLKEWNVKYHDLKMGKPTADLYIDDKALSVNDWRRLGFEIVSGDKN